MNYNVNDDESGMIGVYTLFTLFLLVSYIKNYIANSNGGSRKIRSELNFIVFVYLLFNILMILSVILEDFSFIINMTMMTVFISISVQVLSMSIFTDYKKEGASVGWENVGMGKTSKTSDVDCIKGFSAGTLIAVLKVFTIILLFTSFISFLITFSDVYLSFFFGGNYILALVILFYFGKRGTKYKKMVEKNAKYNFYKHKLFKYMDRNNIHFGNESNYGGKAELSEICIILIPLYFELFGNKFYLNNSDNMTNSIGVELVKVVRKNEGMVKGKYIGEGLKDNEYIIIY